MAQPFKFRYVNEIAGCFVLLVVLLFAAGIVLAGRAQGWFEKEHRVSFFLPVERSTGLQEGAAVEIHGTEAGRVDSILPDTEERMRAILSIKREFFPYVREDSQVIIKRQFVLVGDAYVEITRGEGTPVAEDHHFESCELGGELIDSVQELLDEAKEKKLVDTVIAGSLDVRDSLLDVLALIHRFIDEYTKIAATMNDPEGPLLQILARVDRISATIEAGEGTVGKVLMDPTLAENIVALTGRVDGTLDEVDAILANVRALSEDLPDLSRVEAMLELVNALLVDLKAVTEQLPAMVEMVDGELKAVPGIVYRVQSSLDEAEDLMKSIKKHWLIRSYVEEEGLPTPIPPGRVEPDGPVPERSSEKGGRP